MWPWEHVVVGYVGFSLCARLVYRRPPTDWAALAVVVGSLFPDLVDKPLAWQFGVFEGGYALGHSLFLAVPLSLAGWLWARRRYDHDAAVGFAAGYLFHLAGDVVPYLLQTGRFDPERILWPLYSAGPSGAESGFFEQLFAYLLPYVGQLLSGHPSDYLLAQLSLMLLAFVLWLVDGRPGLGPFVDGASSLGRRLVP